MFHKKSLFFFIFLLINIINISALDLTAGFNIGNLGFNIDRSSSSMALIWGTSIVAEHKIDANFHFSGGFFIDDITGMRIDSQLRYKSRYFEIGVGPSIASINNNQIQIKPAINGFVQVKIDGLFFLSTEIYSTIGNLSDLAADYSQLQTTLSLGFYIPGAICILSAENKQFSQFNRDSSSIESKTTDLYSIYKLEADIHKKNIPFHLILAFGYRDLQRIFPANDPDGRTLAGVGSAFIGVATKIDLGKRFILNAGIDSGIYNFTLSDVITPDELPIYLFNTFISLTYKF